MDIPKPTDADKDRFRDLVPDDPRVQVKAMFGNLGAFVNGNMFAGLGSTIGVKLNDQDRQDLEALGAGPFGPTERPMGGYLTLPDTVIDDPDAAVSWISRALDHVAALPAKKLKAGRVTN